MPVDNVKINNCSKERRAIIKQEMENLMKELALKMYNKETDEALCRAEGSWLRIQLRRIYCTEGLSEQEQKYKGDKILHDVFKRPERSYFQLLQTELEKLKQIGEMKDEDGIISDEESDEDKEEEPEQQEDDLQRVGLTLPPTNPASPQVSQGSEDAPVPHQVPSGQESSDVVEEEEQDIEIAMAASFARMSVDAQTPSRRSTVEEVDLICRIFPEPVAVEFQEACCKLKNSFENASMNDIEPGVVDIVFKAHLAYLKAVHDHSVPSLLRDEFLQVDKVEKSKLDYENGAILLSFDNLHHLLQLLSSQVLSVPSGRKQNEHLPYIMGVLMPEFLTRMVMSVYKINKDMATTKIKELSVHLSSILFDV